MPSITRRIIICEGASEYVYLQRLNAFLQSLPIPEGWEDVPLRYIGKPSKEGVGSGTYKRVERAFLNTRSANPKISIHVWVDLDLYLRNEKDCGRLYTARDAKKIPPFAFSTMVFEDFYALHADDERFLQWREILLQAGHFSSPLYAGDYMPLFQKTFPRYSKANLPADFLSVESLRNTIRHAQELPHPNAPALGEIHTFHNLLIDDLRTFYPTLFAPGATA